MSAIPTKDVEIGGDLGIEVSSSVPNEYSPEYSGYQKGSKYQESTDERNGQGQGYVNPTDEIYDKPNGKAAIDSDKPLRFTKSGLIVLVVMIFLMLLIVVQFASLGMLPGRLTDVESDNKELWKDRGQTTDDDDNTDTGNRNVDNRETDNSDARNAHDAVPDSDSTDSDENSAENFDGADIDNDNTDTDNTDTDNTDTDNTDTDNTDTDNTDNVNTDDTYNVETDTTNTDNTDADNIDTNNNDVNSNDGDQTEKVQENVNDGGNVDFASMERRIQKNITQLLNDEIESVMDTVNELDSDVEELTSLLNAMQNDQTFENPVDSKTADQFLEEAGVSNTSRYVTDYGYIKIQERTGATLSFYRNLTEYKNGFSDTENHWIGLDVIHKLTSKYTWILRIEALDMATGFLAVGEYYRFRVSLKTTSIDSTLTMSYLRCLAPICCN